MDSHEIRLTSRHRDGALRGRGLDPPAPVETRAPGVAIGPRSEEAGFTFVQLMVTVALIGIMTAGGAVMVGGALGTYQRNGAARQILAAMREAQSLAITRGAVVQLQWGGGAGVGLPASQYRIVRDSTGACSFPAVAAAVDGTNVIRGWRDLTRDYARTSIQSITDPASNSLGGVMFNSLGASVNTCASVSFPVTVTVVDRTGRTRNIAVQNAGGTILQ